MVRLNLEIDEVVQWQQNVIEEEVDRLKKKTAETVD